MRTLVCRVLRQRENSDNWSPYPNIDNEVRGLVDECQWFEVYDILEEVYVALKKTKRNRPAAKMLPWDDDNIVEDEVQGAGLFAKELNKYFQRRGSGWQLAEGRIQLRGSRDFVTTQQRLIGHYAVFSENLDGDDSISCRPGEVVIAQWSAQVVALSLDTSRGRGRRCSDVCAAVHPAAVAADAAKRGPESCGSGQRLGERPRSERVQGAGSLAAKPIAPGPRLGLEQAQLAKSAGLHLNAISNFEKGKAAPHDSTRLAIQEALESRGIVLTNGDKPGFYFDKDKVIIPA